MWGKRLSVDTDPHQGPHIWGANKEDLVTVEISSTQSNPRTRSVGNLSNVTYKRYGQEETISLPIDFYTVSGLEYSADRDSVQSELQPLLDQLTPLGTMIEESDTNAWSTSTDPKTMCPERGICRAFVRAFLMDMTDTDGKSAVRLLLSEICSHLDLGELDVVATGAESHVTAYSTSYQHITVLTIDEKSLTIIPDQTLSTSDILVFSQSPNLDEPIQTKLVVSVKSGFHNNDTSDLIKELMSSLPYQTGHIFGLQINSGQATLCAVKAESVGASEQMNISIYPFYIFRRFNKPFDFGALSNMVVDIGCLLKSN